MTEFISTRDPGKNKSSYTDVLLEGLAPDGGLYVLDTYPKITLGELDRLRDQPYRTIFTEVRSRLIGKEIPLETQSMIANAAYTHDKFPAAVNGNIVPVTSVGDNLYIQNLSLGPTAAFKDMAMQPLGQDME